MRVSLSAYELFSRLLYKQDECCILTFDKAVNQGFLYTGCTCVNKLIPGKQAIRGYKQITGIDN